MTFHLTPVDTTSISKTIENLRSLCQINILSSWVSQQGNLEINELVNSDLSGWQSVKLNQKNQVVWDGGKQVLWLAQRFTVPESLQGYPLTGLCLRLSLLWWADVAEVYVNGSLVLTGDLFDCSPRVLLSQEVKPGDEFFVCLRLVSPGHCDGALVRSLLIFESLDYNDLDAGIVADELAIAQVLLERFSPQGLVGLVAGVDEVTNRRDAEDAEEEREEEECENFIVNLRQLLLQSKIQNLKSKIYLLGHAHLDLAWLWPVSETWNAAQNTFESVLKLQSDFSELIFCHSTPALYAWVEENRPLLFREIQNQVKSGRWEVLGGFWVEPDLNLISGESIVRQLLYGQRYFLQKFGKISPIVWVPDTFGFCATLPQFLTQAGIEFFVTQKLRWNDTTKFDYGLFWWRSPDGSQILSYMSALIGEGIDPVKMTEYLCEWQTQTGLNDALWLPGVGDHGGGPTRDMLEVARRWEHSPILPKLQFTTAENYLHHIKSESEKLPDNLQVWEDELYLEFHRGCYTTHADQKRFNRKSEHLLYQAELFATLATSIFGCEYPQMEIETAWKKVLFNQFHDILPGSSITQVYHDALPEWEDVQKTGNRILDDALRAIAYHITLPQPPQPNSIPIIILNSLNWERSEVVKVNLPQNILTPNQSAKADLDCIAPELHSEGKINETWKIYNIQGNELPSQQTANSLLFLATVPSIGYQIYWLSPTSEKSNIDKNELPKNWTLENDYLQVKINPQTGDIDSIFDKNQQREILNGAGNQLQAFQDSGQYWDAWNIDPNYSTKPLPPSELLSIQWLEHGEIQQNLQVIRKIGKSEFIQNYILPKNTPILKIQNTVNWQENQVLLKTSFPLNFTTETATYEIPCGVINRPTNPQTPAEQAKWEVPALHWADLTTETDNVKYGFSLLNDCKYGYDAKNNQIRLTLLRSPNWPDPEADRGNHEFTYSLYPHFGSWQEAETVKKGYELNIPLNVLVNPESQKSESGILPNQSFLKLADDNLIITAFKVSEDDSRKIILRFYECHGETAELGLESEYFRLGEAVDLLERKVNAEVEKIAPWKIGSFEIRV